MFKTSQGEARYFAAYDATLTLWPVAVTSLKVSTRFGTTHVNICGPEDAPALLLLHGSAISSTMWYPNIEALSRTYRVYAPDIIGEMGKSIRTHPMTKPADYVDCLGDLIDGLQLEQMHVIGISFGGYLAIQLANAAPQRVSKLVMLSPAALLSIRPRFYLRMAAAVLVPFLPFETRQKLILGVASENARSAIKQLMTPTDFQYKMFFPPLITDAELIQIKAATLLLIGDQEVIYHPQTALKRAVRMIPRIDAGIISGAGHALTLDQPDIVNHRILTFLETS